MNEDVWYNKEVSRGWPSCYLSPMIQMWLRVNTRPGKRYKAAHRGTYYLRRLWMMHDFIQTVSGMSSLRGKATLGGTRFLMQPAL